MVLPSEQFEMVEESASIGSLTLVAKRKVSLAGRDAFNRSNEQLRFIDFNAPPQPFSARLSRLPTTVELSDSNNADHRESMIPPLGLMRWPQSHP
jgi:hypothetical protein